MAIFSKRYLVKIPKDISVLYCEKKKLLTFIGPLSRKSLQLKLKILILKPKNHIIITRLPLFGISGNEKKKLKTIQKTNIALIKQIILEISFVFSKKLTFVGVGYKAFPIELFKNHILHFKLGYSHQIYFKISHTLNVFCLKATTIFISGNSYQEVSQISALIRSYKYPEPYKGKGILYENEKIIIKEGKKV
jgi:large subunit ribosomal protein L6